MSDAGDDGTVVRLGMGLGAGVSSGLGWSPPAAETLASAIPGLRVLALAGRGGMGAVYRAEQTRLGRLVAVKVMASTAPGGASADPVAEERFEREARVLAGLAHPHVLQIYDAGRLPDGTRYLVTEWAEGGDLAALTGRKPQPPEKVSAWIAQVAAALDAAHARGVVHRDLKPANVLVRADGRLALADFGVARAQGEGFTTTLTLSGAVYGTADYMAPEQMRGEAAAISPATDVYALGVMTYELLTGRVPRGAFTPASRMKGVSEAVDAVIMAALADDPARRTRTAGEFSRALERALDGADTRSVRGPVLWVTVLLGVLAVAALLMPLGSKSPGPEITDASESSRPVAALTPATTPSAAREPVPEPERAEPAPVAEMVAATTTSETAPVPAAVDIAPPAAASVDPVVAPEAGPAMAPGTATREVRKLLPAVDLAAASKRGGWSRRGGELVSDGAVCWLGFAQSLPADFRYELVVEFTRTSGLHSVGVFLPTAAGTGVFELDAWEAGVGGLQMIDGRDIRANGTSFPAALRNGERQQVHLVVDGTTVSITWNGVHRRTVDLAGRRFENNWMWEAGGSAGLGVCSWQSPTVFHRVDYRAR